MGRSKTTLSGSSGAKVQCNGLTAAVDSQFLEDVANVKLDRIQGDPEITGNLLVGAPGGEIRQDFELAAGQRAERIVVDRAHIDVRKDHAPGRHRRDRVEQVGRLFALRNESGATMGHDMGRNLFALVPRVHDDFRWVALGVQVVEQEEVRARYAFEEVRVSVSWKAQVFATPEQQALYHSHEDDLTLDEVVDAFHADLAAKGTPIAPPADPLHDPDFIEALTA